MKKIFLVISTISVLFLAGCNKNIVENENNQLQEEQSNNQNINSDVNNDESNIYASGDILQNEKVVKKIDDSKELVYTIYEENYKDNIFKTPYINIDSEDVKKINDEMNTQFKSYISNVKAEYKDGDGGWFNQTYNYISNINDNILTVVITFDDEYNFGIEEVYNIDIYTGKQLNNENVLELNKLDGKKYDLEEVYTKVFLDAFAYNVPIYLKDDFIENKKIQGNLYIANEINGDYGACLNYYKGKTLEDTKYYFGDNNNIYAEIIHMAPAGAIMETRNVVNVTEILSDKGNNWYMIQDSDKVFLKEDTNWEGLNDSLNHLSNNELNIAYNEIFARHGHDFESKDLKEHFSNMLWYTSIEGKQVSIEELNDIEKANIKIIKDEIEKRKVLLQKFNNGIYEGQST